MKSSSFELLYHFRSLFHRSATQKKTVSNYKFLLNNRGQEEYESVWCIIFIQLQGRINGLELSKAWEEGIVTLLAIYDSETPYLI